MTQRIVFVGLLVAFVTTNLPANVFAEDSHPLASLRTSAGLSKALQSGQVPSPKDVMRPPSKGVRAQAQQGSGPFFSSTGGRLRSRLSSRLGPAS